MTLDEIVDDPRIVLRPENASGEHYRALFERSPIAQLLAAPDGRLLQVNVAFAQLLGRTPSELRGCVMAELIAPEDRAAFGVLTRRALARAGDAVANELRFCPRSGQALWLRVTSAWLRVADGSSCIMHTFEDIGERHRNEEEVRKLIQELSDRSAALEASHAEVESFSYSISHDLRAPLRSIDGFSRLLLERCAAQLDDAGREFLQRIASASQRMHGQIDHLLELARVSRSELAREPVDVGELARTIAHELHAADSDRHVDWQIGAGLVADADPRLTRMVLCNLLGNAWKYSSKRATARIELGRIERDGAQVFFVRDDGVGFDMAYASRLFGAFQRLHGASEFSGDGIGLALVQRVVRRHGGRIWAESTLDRGATFYFTLQPAPAARDGGSRRPLPRSYLPER